MSSGRWVFPSRWLNSVSPIIDSPKVHRIPAALFSLVFPDECRICGSPLENVSRIPVCAACLNSPKPLIAEHFCAKCGTPFLNASPLDEDGVCGLCRRGLTGFDAAFSFGEYDGALRGLIHLFKYGRVAPLAGPLGRFLITAIPRTQNFDVIVPMPLHWRRQWTRGFNQADLLARSVSARLAIPLRRPLRRRRATAPQAGLTNAQRRDNVAGAFRVKDARAIAGKHVLLVDDVLTTGATLSAAAGALKRGGARRVTVLALARADRRRYSYPIRELDSSLMESGEPTA